MATIAKRKTESGEVRYLAQVRLKGHPPHSRTFERKTDATRWHRKPRQASGRADFGASPFASGTPWLNWSTGTS